MIATDNADKSFDRYVGVEGMLRGVSGLQFRGEAIFRHMHGARSGRAHIFQRAVGAVADIRQNFRKSVGCRRRHDRTENEDHFRASALSVRRDIIAI